MKPILLFLISLTIFQYSLAQYGINPPKSPPRDGVRRGPGINPPAVGRPSDGRVGIGDFESEQSARRIVNEIFELGSVETYLRKSGEDETFIETLREGLIPVIMQDAESAHSLREGLNQLRALKKQGKKLTASQQSNLVSILLMTAMLEYQ